MQNKNAPKRCVGPACWVGEANAIRAYLENLKFGVIRNRGMKVLRSDKKPEVLRLFAVRDGACYLAYFRAHKLVVCVNGDVNRFLRYKAATKKETTLSATPSPPAPSNPLLHTITTIPEQPPPPHHYHS